MANSEIAPLALPMSQPLDLPGHRSTARVH